MDSQGQSSSLKKWYSRRRQSIPNRKLGAKADRPDRTQQRTWRLSDEPINPDSQTEELDPQVRAETKCSVFLGYTSNLVSSGLREVIRFLVEHNYVSCLVTTAGGIEEDLIKCLGPTFLAPRGEFNHDGAGLRRRGLNRIGNLLVPNDNYCKFEDWVMPILDQMVHEQEQDGVRWSPSKVIDRLGAEINDESSILYWAHKVSLPPARSLARSGPVVDPFWCVLTNQNKIPVFCPALTDGSLGDMMYFHTCKFLQRVSVCASVDTTRTTPYPRQNRNSPLDRHRL